MRQSKYTLATEHGRCTLHLWSEDRNLVRRVGSTALRNGVLRLSTHRLRPDRAPDPRTHPRQRPHSSTPSNPYQIPPSSRTRPPPQLSRPQTRSLPHRHGSRKAAARRSRLASTRPKRLGRAPPSTTKDPNHRRRHPRTLGILWLHHCPRVGDGRTPTKGLKLIVPAARGRPPRSLSPRLGLNPTRSRRTMGARSKPPKNSSSATWPTTATSTTRLLHAPNEQAAKERFAAGLNPHPVTRSRSNAR